MLRVNVPRPFLFFCCLAIMAGLSLGCCAPGVGVWITAWFCLAPLLFIVGLERSLFKTFVYGFLFGLAYNCIYWQWLLNLAPLNWLGFDARQGQLMAWAALLIVASHQAIIVAIFALTYRLIFCSSLFVFTDRHSWLGNWLHILLVPLAWILIVNKLGNAHCLLGVPWSMLEYSQYKNLGIIQIADIIGGIGISYLLVMINTLIARFAMRFFTEAWKVSTGGYSPLSQRLGTSSAYGGRLSNLNKYWPTLKPLLPSTVFTIIVLAAVIYYGQCCRAVLYLQPSELVSIVQPNINIEMYKAEKKYSLDELLALEMNLAQQCPPGLCVWTEGAVPARLATDIHILKQLQNLCASKNLSLIVGTIDQDKHGHSYNAAAAISVNQQVTNEFYHKRYLVPFGEYTPAFVDYLPYSQLIRTLTNTPAGTGYSCGQKAAILKLHDKLTAPLICFEVIAPELAAASVRIGGQLLVNINDLSWFHQSIIGEQMIACGVLRAVENRRYCVFAANTGPSAIITPLGEIQAQMRQNVPGVLTGKIDYLSDLTLFTRWYIL